MSGRAIMRKLTYREMNRIRPYLLLLPALMIISLVIFYPIVKAVAMSFQSVNLIRLDQVHFIGLQNYIRVLRDPVFWVALKNTVIYVLGSVGFQFVLGFITALLINQEFKCRGLIRGLILIPWALPGVLAAFMWSLVLNGNYGLVNDVLFRLGIIKDFIPWLSQPNTALGATILATVWRGAPFFAVMLLAGLQAVPVELREAARIDGANRYQEFANVTIPIMMPVIITTTLLRIIWTANFVEIIYLMTQGGPGYSSQVLCVYTFMCAKGSLDYGFASALAMFLTLILLATIGMYLRQAKKAGVNI